MFGLFNKKKIADPPKYCTQCGKPLSLGRKTLYFDSQTGHEIQRDEYYCPTRIYSHDILHWTPGNWDEDAGWVRD